MVKVGSENKTIVRSKTGTKVGSCYGARLGTRKPVNIMGENKTVIRSDK